MVLIECIHVYLSSILIFAKFGSASLSTDSIQNLRMCSGYCVAYESCFGSAICDGCKMLT